MNNRWYNNAIIYHIYPLGFCGAPKFNEGGPVQYILDKLIDWIPHLKEMNVDTLFEAILRLETLEECYNFFDDLCTVQELKALPEASMDTAFKTAALTILALCRYEQSPEDAIEMLNL